MRQCDWGRESREVGVYPTPPPPTGPTPPSVPLAVVPVPPAPCSLPCGFQATLFCPCKSCNPGSRVTEEGPQALLFEHRPDPGPDAGLHLFMSLVLGCIPVPFICSCSFVSDFTLSRDGTLTRRKVRNAAGGLHWQYGAVCVCVCVRVGGGGWLAMGG